MEHVCTCSLDMNTGTASHGALIMVRPRLYFQMHVSIIVMLICQSFPIVELRRPVEVDLYLTRISKQNVTILTLFIVMCGR